MEYLKKHRFGTLYKGLFPNRYKVLVSISLSFRTSRWLLIQHWFCAARNSLSEFFPPRISCHASCFSESVPNVSQSRFAIKRGKSLYFRLGRSRHSRNSPVHRSIIGRILPLTEFILLKRNVKSSFSCCISLVWKFQNVVCGFLTKESPLMPFD